MRSKALKRSQFIRKNVRPEQIRSFYISEGVTVIGICDWITAVFGPSVWKHRWFSWDLECEIMQEWCKRFNVSYYSDPREEFFEYKGIEKAHSEGNSFVIVEDMS